MADIGEKINGLSLNDNEDNHNGKPEAKDDSLDRKPAARPTAKPLSKVQKVLDAIPRKLEAIPKKKRTIHVAKATAKVAVAKPKTVKKGRGFGTEESSQPAANTTVASSAKVSKKAKAIEINNSEDEN